MRALTATVLLLVSMAVSAAPEMVTIAKKDMQAVISYLATRPYNEVYQLVSPLLRAQPVVEPKPKEVAKKTKSRKSKESKK